MVGGRCRGEARRGASVGEVWGKVAGATEAETGDESFLAHIQIYGFQTPSRPPPPRISTSASRSPNHSCAPRYRRGPGSRVPLCLPSSLPLTFYVSFPGYRPHSSRLLSPSHLCLPRTTVAQEASLRSPFLPSFPVSPPRFPLPRNLLFFPLNIAQPAFAASHSG